MVEAEERRGWRQGARLFAVRPFWRRNDNVVAAIVCTTLQQGLGWDDSCCSAPSPSKRGLLLLSSSLLLPTEGRGRAEEWDPRSVQWKWWKVTLLPTHIHHRKRRAERVFFLGRTPNCRRVCSKRGATRPSNSSCCARNGTARKCLWECTAESSHPPPPSRSRQPGLAWT